MAHFRIDWGDGTITEVPQRQERSFQYRPVAGHTVHVPPLAGQQLQKLTLVAGSQLCTIWNAVAGIEYGPVGYTLQVEPADDGGFDVTVVGVGGNYDSAFFLYANYSLTERAMPDVPHIYVQPGVYQVQVEAVQPDGASVVATGSVTVTALGKQPAVIDYGGYTSHYSFPNYLTSG